MTRKAQWITTLAVVLAAALAPCLHGGVDAVLDRGYNIDNLYEVHGFDDVNLFNGNLQLNVPLGPAYKTNGTLEYKFMLHYNSSFWEYNNLEVSGGGAGQVTPVDFYTQMNHFYDEAENRAGSSTSGTEAFISPEFNSGVGWTISLGELPSYLLYISPDGNRHGLFATLHGNDPLGFDYRRAQYLYTRDGTYIRMKRIPQSADVEKYRELQFPNGVRHRFKCIADCGSGRGGQWQLDQLADPYGNVLWVSRPSRPAAGNLWTWTFMESVRNSTPPAGSDADSYYADHVADAASLTDVRSHQIDFEIDDDLYMHAVSVRLSGPNSGTIYTPNMTYKLEYATGSNAEIYRTHASNWAGPGLINQFLTDGKIRVKLLTRVAFPPPGTGMTAAGEWLFQYLNESQVAAADDPLDPSDPLVERTWGTFHYKTAWYSGLLSKVTLPTKGYVTYRWGRRGIPALACDPVRRGERRSFGKPAIAKRQQWLADDTKDGKAWLYFGRGIWDTTVDCGAPREYLSTVVDPLGNSTVSFYSVYIGTGDGYWDEREFGAPVSKADVVGSGDTVKFISTESYKCTYADFLNPLDPLLTLDVRNDRLRRVARPPAGAARSCGNPVRSEYIRFRNSGFNCDPAVPTSCTAVNRIVHGTRTVYHDDADSFAETENSGFDGLGHFRTSLMAGGGGFDSALTREEYTNFNPGSSESSIPSGSAWFLEIYDEKRQQQGTNQSRTFASFDTGTGRLLRERRLKSSSMAAGDTLVVYERSRNPSTPTLTTIETKTYGGDVDGQNLGTTDALKFSENGHSPAYHRLTRLQYGTESYSDYRDGSLPVLKTADNTIDPKSGLVTASVSTSGARTTYSYDNLGRLTTVTPELDPSGGDHYLREASIGYTYTAATGASEDKRAQVLVKRPSDCTTNCLSQVRTTFDHFGRVNLRQTMMPGNRWSRVVKRYGPTGWLEQVSTPHDTSGIVSYTTYSYCDADPPNVCDLFGRPRRITAPDSSKTDISYGGVRTINRKILNVKGPNNSNHSVQSFEEYDRFGRLIKVSDFSDPNASGTVATSYTYDVGGHITDVTMSNQQQKRTFSYDGRGFLTSEYHPEVGKTFTYGKNDALGHATQRTVTGAEAYSLGYQYDKAERLEKVFPASFSDRPIVEYKYFDSNTDACGTNAGLAIGKVRVATRHNLVPNVNATNQSLDYPVTETFLYRGVEGRMSHRTTTVSRPNNGGDVHFRQGFRYNALGLPSEVDYPTCPECGDSVPARTVSNTYSFGLLNGVSNYASIQYHINGMVSDIIHTTTGVNGNSIRDVQGLDPHGMLRPMKIWTQFVQNGDNWNPQGKREYSYDGAGNLDGVSDPANPGDPAREKYGYDDANRLVSAYVGGTAQDYVYDRWGNLTSIGGTPVAVNPSNNRLASTLATYNDGAGTLRSLGSYSYEYDLLNMMRHAYGSGLGKIFLYTADNQRIATFDYKAMDSNNAPAVRETWTLRGASQQVLRVYEKLGTWTWKKDYIYRGRNLLASTGVEGERRYHLDHLGTPRLITDGNGAKVSYHAYLPFGREVTQPDIDSEVMKFTGHERDNNNPIPGARDGDLDYMHARYYTPQYGRFLSVDPAIGSLRSPQSWNRYSYVRNNPMSLIDPTGAVPETGDSHKNDEDDDLRARCLDCAGHEVIEGGEESSESGEMPSFIEGRYGEAGLGYVREYEVPGALEAELVIIPKGVRNMTGELYLSSEELGGFGVVLRLDAKDGAFHMNNSFLWSYGGFNVSTSHGDYVVAKGIGLPSGVGAHGELNVSRLAGDGAAAVRSGWNAMVRALTPITSSLEREVEKVYGINP
jgi:RHS repeat-associated protein